MRDYYQDGFNDGYGNKTYGERECPQSDGDRYNYEQGTADGKRRKNISDELEREGY